MKTSRNFLHSFISLGLLLSLATSPALGVQTREPISKKVTQFSLIEQPLMRIGMTLGGFALLGLFIASAMEASKGEKSVSDKGISLDQQPV
ncbi:MAG: hypothetical protein QNJ46_20770 [Leptolyngbyaceae cyanobacterium MO_188.B28]|nr:hypothetical protein [Leptolyngbyaceae cyanobacterium MO_188.B28]